MKRRDLLLAAGAGATLTAGTPPAGPAVLHEWTFLRSLDADPADLIAFVQANWFAMDRVAVARGLMSSYALLRADGPGGEWNVVVIVGYPDARGYAGIAPAFEAIRAAHVIVPVDGRVLKQLGVIVASRRLLPV